MLETKTEVINEHTYTCKQFPALMAVRFKCRIIKMFGAAVKELFSKQKNLKKEDLADKLVVGDLIEILQKTASSFSEEDLESFIVDALQMCTRDGRTLDRAAINVVFQDSLEDIYYVLWFALKTNYQNFFQNLGFVEEEKTVDQKAKKAK